MEQALAFMKSVRGEQLRLPLTQAVAGCAGGASIRQYGHVLFCVAETSAF